jgi:hypothetical protein
MIGEATFNIQDGSPLCKICIHVLLKILIVETKPELIFHYVKVRTTCCRWRLFNGMCAKLLLFGSLPSV